MNKTAPALIFYPGMTEPLDAEIHGPVTEDDRYPDYYWVTTENQPERDKVHESRLATWYTLESHPASNTRYQMATLLEADIIWARVLEDGHEVVSPSRDRDSVYRQYKGRVNRAISE